MSNHTAIFDMDGVLVDTYRAHYASWLEVTRAEGVDFTEEDFAATFGCTSREVIATLWARQRLEVSERQTAAMDARKEAAFRRIIETQVPVMPGALALLEDLRRQGFSLALGSSAPSENVELVVDRLRLGPLLGAVVTGRDVTRGKPDPQVFLLAAERLGAPPGRCVVIEDAPVGIAAARAAGMASVGLASTGRTRQSLADAELVIDRLDELSPEVLRRLIAYGLPSPFGRGAGDEGRHA
ncbi:MAG: HAD family phosphatase [Thermoguttaceae bacterium]